MVSWSWSVIAAGCCVALLLLPVWDGVFRRWRLREAVDAREADPPAAVGLDAALAMLVAGVRAGGTLEESLSRMSGQRLGGTVDRYAVVRALAVHARDGELAYVERIAVEVCAAAQLSVRLGCELGSCLETVSASFRRSVGRDRLVAQASAMPKATVKLLLVLPVGTWAFGGLLGAHPLRTLVGSSAGAVCLCLGVFGYAIGAVWVRSMMRSALQDS